MQKRLDYLDTAKGVLIILIILGHVFFGEKIMYFAYTFHLSSFLIITGILIRHVDKVSRPFMAVCKDAIYTFLIPFVFFETIGAVVKYLTGTALIFPDCILDPLRGSCHVGADWYLLTAFTAELLFIAIEKLPGNKYLKLLIYTAMFFTGCLLPKEPFCFLFISRVMIAAALIAAGYYLYMIYTSADCVLIMISAIAVYLCTVYNGFVSLYSITVGNPFLYMLGSISGAYLCIALCHLFPLKPLAYVGKNSLILMGTHQNFIETLTSLNRYELLAVICIAEIPIIWFIRKYLPFCAGIRHKKKT